MHQALLIQEIQYHIFDQIQSKQTLSALARTCQAFTENALDVQWRDLDCFTRLIECMPHGLWSRDLKENKIKDYTFRLRRSISPSDWAIFQKYSVRVRSVSGPFMRLDAFTVDMDTSCLLSLCSSSAPIPLLPNLKSLNWIIFSNVGIFVLSRLVSPCLTSLGVRMRPDFALASSFQFALPIPIDQLRLSLKSFADDEGKPYSVSLLDAMKRSVDELRNLNTISWSNLGNQSIVSLARLPALRKAVFELPSDFPTYIERLPPHSPTMKPTFSRLRILGITHRDFASVTALLNNFEFHLMEDVRITSHYTSPSTSMQGFFAALASSSSHKTIRCITVYDELRGLGPDLTRFELGFHELRPLLQFEMLTYLNLHFVGLIILEDATLLKMADAWPHISSLHLNGRGPWHPGSHINPLTFIKVLERCPKLDELNIPMDFSAVDYVDFDPWLLDDLRNQDRKRAELSLLWLGPYIAVHPHAVAKFLAAVLPRLADIKMLAHNSSDPVACVQSWTQTEHIYLGFVMNRKRQISAKTISHLSAVNR